MRTNVRHVTTILRQILCVEWFNFMNVFFVLRCYRYREIYHFYSLVNVLFGRIVYLWFCMCLLCVCVYLQFINNVFTVHACGVCKKYMRIKRILKSFQVWMVWQFWKYIQFSDIFYSTCLGFLNKFFRTFNKKDSCFQSEDFLF